MGHIPSSLVYAIGLKVSREQAGTVLMRHVGGLYVTNAHRFDFSLILDYANYAWSMDFLLIGFVWHSVNPYIILNISGSSIRRHSSNDPILNHFPF